MWRLESETVNILIVPCYFENFVVCEMKREMGGCSSGILICREGFWGFGIYVNLFIEKRIINQFVLMLKM